MPRPVPAPDDDEDDEALDAGISALVNECLSLKDQVRVFRAEIHLQWDITETRPNGWRDRRVVRYGTVLSTPMRESPLELGEMIMDIGRALHRELYRDWPEPPAPD